MKPISICLAAALLAIPAALAGSSNPAPGKAEPAIVPYSCDGGRAASVVYQSGSDYLHARALITFDGRTVPMRSAPTLYGVRYRGEAAPDGRNVPLAWSLRGEEARLTESPDEQGYAAGERELARCVRRRGADVAGRNPDHGPDRGH